MGKDKLKLELPDPIIEATKLFQQEVGGIKKAFNFLIVFIGGVMVIGFLTLLFALAGLIIQTWNSNSSAINNKNILNYQQDVIDEINIKLNMTLDTIGSIKDDVNELKNK